jgi:hypothetical protein
MRYEIRGNSLLRGGADVNISQVGDIYILSGHVSAEVGKKVFGKWITVKSLEKDFSIRVPKEKLTEVFVENTDEFQIDGVVFKRKTPEEFSLAAQSASGTVKYKCDGFDPIDVESVEVSAFGITARFDRA